VLYVSLFHSNGERARLFAPTKTFLFLLHVRTRGELMNTVSYVRLKKCYTIQKYLLFLLTMCVVISLKSELALDKSWKKQHIMGPNTC
jgi:hypothetical protein